MSSITFTETTTEIDLKAKATYVSYAVPVDPNAPEGAKMKINIAHFHHGNSEQWVGWLQQFKYVRDINRWTTGPVLFQNARILLRDTARSRFEECRQATEGNDTVPVFDNTILSLTELYCPGRPAFELKEYMRETPKPLSMTMDQYYAWLEKMNSYLAYLQPLGNTVLTQQEMIQVVKHNVPRAWRNEYEASGQDFETVSRLCRGWVKYDLNTKAISD